MKNFFLIIFAACSSIKTIDNYQHLITRMSEEIHFNNLYLIRVSMNEAKSYREDVIELNNFILNEFNGIFDLNFDIAEIKNNINERMYTFQGNYLLKNNKHALKEFIVQEFIKNIYQEIESYILNNNVKVDLKIESDEDIKRISSKLKAANLFVYKTSGEEVMKFCFITLLFIPLMISVFISDQFKKINSYKN